MFLIFLSSCQNKKEKEIQKFITYWNKKEIIFPLTLQEKQDSLWKSAMDKQFKIFTYVDTCGCTECQLKLYEWEKLHHSLDSFSNNTAIIYIVYSQYPQYIELLKKRNHISFLLFIDEQNKIGKRNNLSSKLLYKTFLLDSMNRIILFGNPIQNEQIWNLYKQTITNK